MPSADGALTLGDVLAAYGFDPNEVLTIRHTSSDELPAGASEAQIVAFTRSQYLRPSKIPQSPPPLWVLFWADGGRRARYYGAFRNRGECLAERTDTHRYFDLRPDDALAALRDRLVIEWSRDAINWAKGGSDAASFPIIEITDTTEFPGFDGVLLSHSALKSVVSSPRYSKWRAALASVQGIYLIADTASGGLYVGQAAGQGGILGRWKQYASDGHGGNTELAALVGGDPGRMVGFQYSILRVFGLGASPAQIYAAEEHYKRALLSRSHGMNRN